MSLLIKRKEIENIQSVLQAINSVYKISTDSK